MKEIEISGSMPYCSPQLNEVQFGFGSSDIRIMACPGEINSYEILIYECVGEDKDYEEKEILKITIPLTKKEFGVAMDSSIEDIEFIDDIDGLVFKRVARDIFSFFIQSLLEREFIDNTIMSERFATEWAQYIKYLIQMKMDGKTIAPYHYGYEPESNQENSTEK